ncbi:flavodoxin domain-containing protein [Streptomyces sp. NPDC001922]|uniref:flavodoxin domain-containing protein n=1 Tax=Streptomyces sp. NPDC001922 TaxID=3364624 RepID=UPI0036B83A8D
MNPHHVLVAHGSRNGSTAEIAEWIGETLRAYGPADVRPAAEVEDVEEYDVVVLGGALYAGRWHRDAARFARRHHQALMSRAVWLFSSGPLDASAGERDIPPVPGVRRIAARLDALGHVTFGGRLEEGAKGIIAHQIVKAGRGGDYRDPARVHAWAREIAAELGAATVV